MKDFRSSGFDTAGLGLDDRQEWLVAPVTHTRDSSVLEECNWDQQLQAFYETCGAGERYGETYEIHRFDHWACGWLEIVLINPEHARLVEAGEQIEKDLEDYPVLCDEAYGEACERVAAEVWEGCYSTEDRIAWLRRHYEPDAYGDVYGIGQIEGSTVASFAELLGAARGRYFIGDVVSMAEGR